MRRHLHSAGALIALVGVAAVPSAWGKPGGAGVSPGTAAATGAAPYGLAVRSSTPPAGTPSLPDPFPILRVFLPAAADPTSAPPPAGATRRMTRDAFETRVRAASAALAEAMTPPRLVEARYSARVTDGGMTGTGRWTVAFPAESGGLVPLDPLGLAVSSAHWSGRPAVIYHPSAGADAPAVLWADRADDRAVSFDWSASGVDEPGGRKYVLLVPPAPVATLDLDLDAGSEPATSADILMTGPYPVPGARVNRWRLTFGGLSRVEVGVRGSARRVESDPPIRCDRAAEYVLSSTEADCLFDFDLEPVRGTATEVSLTADASLRVVRVVSRTPGRPVSWRRDGALIRVSFPSPVPSVRLQVTAKSDFTMSQDRPWSLPQIRPAGGLPGADTVAVRTSPELVLDTYDPGDYRVVAASAVAGTGSHLSLTASLVGGSARPTLWRPPAVRVRWADPTYVSAEDVHWRIGPGRTDLAARVRVRAVRGPLPGVEFVPPQGYDVRKITTTPDDPGLGWSTDAKSGTVTVRPTRPIPTDGVVDMRLDLVGPPGPPIPELFDRSDRPCVMAFPPFRLVGAIDRTGAYAVTVDPNLSAEIAPGVLAAESSAADTPGALYTATYRGDPPSGTIVLRTRITRAAATVEVNPAAGRTTAGETITEYRYGLTCDGGAIGGVTVLTPTSDGGTWSLNLGSPMGSDARQTLGGNVASWLPLAGAQSPWSALAMTNLAAARPYDVWRVAFARPVTAVSDLVITASRPRHMPDASRSTVPMPTICGVGPGDTDVRLHAASALRFAAEVDPPNHQLVLRPRSGGRPSGLGDAWRFGPADVLCRVDSGGCDCRLAVRVVRQAARTVGLTLPAGAMPVSVRCDGHDVPGVSASFGPGMSTAIPLPVGGPDGVLVEVRYRLPTTDRGWYARVEARLPTLAGVEPAAAYQWVIDTAFRPVPDIAVPGAAAPAARPRVILVRSAVLHAAGYGLAALVLGLGLTLGLAGTRVGFRVVTAMTAVIGLGVWALPTVSDEVVIPPLVTGLVLMIGYRVARPTGRTGPGSTVSYRVRTTDAGAGRGGRSSLIGLCAALAACGGALTALAGPDAPATVYFTPGPGPTASDRLDALVPVSVLNRLDRLTTPSLSGPVVTRAEYDGVAADTTASFTATFHVYSPTSEARALTLPLSQVRLGDLTLDGKPAYPTADGADGYLVTVPGGGVHRLHVRFEVPLTASGSDREVRFGGPAVPSCRVAFAPPAGVGGLGVPTARGAQSFRDGRVAADHGAGREVAVRWRSADADGSKAAVTVRDVGVWDVWESSARLTSVFSYRIDGGSVSRLQVEIPAGLEPGRIDVRPTDSSSAGIPPGLRDWAMTALSGGRQRLDIDLQGPTSGRATVVMTLHPRFPTATQPTFQFPRAIGVADADSYYALRTRGVAITDVTRVGMIDYPADAIAKEFASVVPELDLAHVPPARVFRHAEGPSPRLTPTLRSSVPEPVGTSSVSWVVGSTVAATGVVTQTSDVSPRSSVEFDLPRSVSVRDVRSPDLVHWGRSGTRVVVWLAKPARTVHVQWSGRLRPPTDPPAPGRGTPLTLDLPVATIGPGTVGSASGVITVRPGDGWSVVPAPDHQASPPDHPAAAGPSPYTATNVSEVTILAYPPPPHVRPIVLTTVDRSGSDVVHRTEVAIPVPTDGPLSVVVQMADLPSDAAVDVRGSPGVRTSETPARPGGRSWDVTVPPGSTGPARVSIALRFPAAPAAPVPIASVWSGVRLLPCVTAWLAVGPGLVIESLPPDLPSASPADLDRLRGDFPSSGQGLVSDRVRAVPGGVRSVRVAPGPSGSDPVESVRPHPTSPGDARPPADATEAATAPVPDLSGPLGLATWACGMALIGRYLYLSTSWPVRLVVVSLIGLIAVGLRSPAGMVCVGSACTGAFVGVLRAAARSQPVIGYAPVGLRSP